MAGEPRQPGRSRPVSGTSSDSPELTTPESDPSTAPITASTPLPPLSLASQPGAGSAAPQPSQEAWFVATDQPAVPPNPPPMSAAAPQPVARGVTSTWAAYSMFALVYTSLILLAAMAIAYAIVTKSGVMIVWAVVLIILFNILYFMIFFGSARAGLGRIPFMNTRRGP